MHCSQQAWLNFFKIRQKQSKLGSIHILYQLDPGKALWSLIWVICSLGHSEHLETIVQNKNQNLWFIYVSNLIFRKREAGLRWAASAVEPGHPANVKSNSSERRKSNFRLNHIKYFQAALYLFDGGKHPVAERPPLAPLTQESNFCTMCRN